MGEQAIVGYSVPGEYRGRRNSWIYKVLGKVDCMAKCADLYGRPTYSRR